MPLPSMIMMSNLHGTLALLFLLRKKVENSLAYNHYIKIVVNRTKKTGATLVQ